MGAGEQLTWRLAPENIGALRGDELVGRIGLAALELLDRQRPGIILDMDLEPGLERGGVEAVGVAHRGRAAVLGAAVFGQLFPPATDPERASRVGEKGKGLPSAAKILAG